MENSYRTDFVPCFSVIVTVIVLNANVMFILQLWTEQVDKHCWYHYDYDYDYEYDRKQDTFPLLKFPKDTIEIDLLYFFYSCLKFK